MTRTPLADPLPGKAGWLQTAEGRIRWYAAGEGRPVLLVHSFNAAAAAHEILPMYEDLAKTRRVVAFDWLGFGRSDRPDIAYDAALYRRHLLFMARLAVADAGRLDVVALSLPSQYVAVEAVARPELFGRLALISPTGFGRFGGAPSARNEFVWRFLRATRVGDLLFGVLARRQVIDWYLAQVFATTWRVPKHLARYSWQTAQEAGAPFAPLRFISGLLNDRSARVAYEALSRPTLLVFGDEPRFSDPDAAAALARRNSAISVATIEHSGDLPQWERREATSESVRAFLG